MFLLAWQYDTGHVWYVPNHNKILDVLRLVRREFRRKSGDPAIIGRSDVSRLTDLEKFTVLVIPDVSGIHNGRVWYGWSEANG